MTAGSSTTQRLLAQAHAVCTTHDWCPTSCPVQRSRVTADRKLQWADRKADSGQACGCGHRDCAECMAAMADGWRPTAEQNVTRGQVEAALLAQAHDRAAEQQPDPWAAPLEVARTA